MNTSKTKEFIKKILQKIRLRYLVKKDIIRFSKNASFSIYDASYEQISARIIYNVHSIEKGLSRTHEFRPGFGKKALAALNDSLVVYTERGFSEDEFPYIEGRSIIIKYIEFHRERGESTTFLKQIIDPKFFIKMNEFSSAGVKEISINDKKNNYSKNFYELSQGRSSVRDFSGESIDINAVSRAIQNATKTPSVCNRQGWSVYLLQNKKKIEQLLEYQRGFKGYPKLPECVLTITVSNSTFLSPVERNEAFVDGGLFAMSVIYGLEYEGLAAVTLNAMMNSKDEKNIRNIVNINNSEQVILFIAVGQFKEKTIVPISNRKPIKEILKIIN